MSGSLTPDTNMALLQATQADAGKIVKSAAKSREIERIEETAKEFEAVFIAEMMKPMFAGISTEAPFGGGKGEEVFRSLLLQEYGKIVSQTGGVGLADAVKEQMIQMQESIDNGTYNQGVLTGAIKDE